jgi:hypothetical protein
MSSTSESSEKEASPAASGATAAELLRHALDEARTLARLEISLAREEMKSGVAVAKTGGVVMGVATAFGLAGFTMCMVAIATAFSKPWLAALILGLILLVVASALVIGAWREMPKKPMGETKDRLSFDLQQLKERAHV